MLFFNFESNDLLLVNIQKTILRGVQFIWVTLCDLIEGKQDTHLYIL